MSRRPVAFTLLLVYLVNLAACNIKSARSVPFESVRTTADPKADVITDVVMRDHQILHFQGHDGRLDADTVRGTVKGKPVNIPLSDIQRIYVLRKNGALSAVGTLALTVVTVGVALGVLLAATSCPFVYSWDGQQWVFDAEPHGGAITQGLERTDVSELEHLVPDHGSYRVMVQNEMPETQYTDLAELWIADHPAGTRVIRDEFGGLRVVATMVAPSSVRDGSGNDLTAVLAAPDLLVWEPAAGTAPDGARFELTLTFARPRGATSATLVSDVGTGTWGAQMMRDFLELRGSGLDDWYAAIDHDSSARAQLHEWNVREELYGLAVQVAEPGGWVTRGMLGGGGPYSAETQSLTLDLRGVVGDTVRLRMRPPAGFWALNSFALSFDGLGLAMQVDTIRASSATDAVQGNVQKDIAAADGHYYTMPNTGDRAFLTFNAPPTRAGMERTVFLHSRGYYRLHMPPGGAPDVATLSRLGSEPDAAARLAASRLAQFTHATAER